jgi:hypothetical protein
MIPFSGYDPGYQTAMNGDQQGKADAAVDPTVYIKPILVKF